MANITDKELLTICNLSNLKMEFAEITYISEKTGEERNHTISSLLEKEYNAIKEKDIDKRAFLKKIEIENNGEKIEIKEPVYLGLEKLKESAPLVMEYFDSFAEGKKLGQQNNIGKFLDEWEIIFGGDNYSIAAETIRVCEKENQDPNIEVISKLPKRGSGQAIKLIIKFKNIIKDKISEQVDRISFGLEHLKINTLGKIMGELFETEVKEFMKETVGTIIKEEIEKLDDPYEAIKKFGLTFNLLETELNIVICKNKDKHCIVIGIRDSDYLNDFENRLNEGNYANEIIALDVIYTHLKKKYFEYDIVFTGIGKAGKLASLYGIIYGAKYKGFFRDKPDSIQLFFKFSLDNPFKKLEELSPPFEQEEAGGLGFVLENTILFLKGILLSTVFGGLPAVALCFIGVFRSIFNLVQTFNENTEKDFIKLKLEKELIENKILENGYISEAVVSEEKFFNSKYLNNVPFKTYIQLTVLYYFYNYSQEQEYKNKVLVLTLNNKKLKNNLTIYFDDKKYITKIVKREEYEINEIQMAEKKYIVEKELNVNDEIILASLIFETILKECFRLRQNFNKYELMTGYYIDSDIKALYNKHLLASEDIQKDVSAELYAPYLNSQENQIQVENSEQAIKISDEYIASFVRSCLNADEDFKEKNIDKKIEDEDYSLMPLGISTVEDKGTLNESFFKVIEDRGKNIALPEHYESVMKELKENPKSIEKYYFIKEDKYVKGKGEVVVGIFDDTKEFAPYKMGFAYSNLDRIKIGLSSLPLYFFDKVDISSINTTKVCSGAILKCSCGTAPKNLMVTSQFSCTDNGNLVATSADKNPITNVGGFGGCKCHDKKPCTNYINLGSWSEISPNNTCMGNNILLSVSTISCTEGGIITIEDSNCKTKAN